MNSGTTAFESANPIDEILHPSFRDRWAPTLAAIITAIHFAAGGLVLGWYYFVVPKLKSEADIFGSTIDQNTAMLIRQSDFVVNYWSLMLIVGLLALKYDFRVMQWGMRQRGLKWGLFVGGSIVTIFLVTVVFGQVIILQARSLFAAPKVRATVQNVVPKIGDNVYLKSNVEATFDGNKVDINTMAFSAKILDVRGEKFLVGDARASKNDVKAWVRRSDVVIHYEALDYYSEQIRNEPGNSRFFVSRGLVWADQAKFGNAVMDFSEAIALDSVCTDAYKQRGIIRRLHGIGDESSNSFNDFSEVIRLAPSDPAGYLWRVFDWDEKGDIDNAINDYTVAIRLDPLKATPYHGRGNHWQTKGDFENAYNDFSEALRLDQADADIHNSIARLWATCPEDRYRDGRKAIEHATTACDLAPFKTPQFIDTLAAAYAETGDFVSAVKWQIKSIEVTPVDARADAIGRLELYRVGKPYRENPKK